METPKEVPNGKSDFLKFLNQIQDILEKAGSSENPALDIYEANIRTPFFMLEGLSRLYNKIFSHSAFNWCKKTFKSMEDKLGAIDYYDGFYKEFSTRNNI